MGFAKPTNYTDLLAADIDMKKGKNGACERQPTMSEKYWVNFLEII